MIVMGFHVDLTAAEIGIMVSVIFAFGGVIVGTARAHINRRVELEVAKKVDDEVKEALNPYLDALKAIPELQRSVTRLDSVVRNGLTERQRRMEDKLDALILHTNEEIRKDIP